MQIRIAQPTSLIYVPNSTTVNDVPIRDVGALGPFASERGIVLNEFDPGVEATIRWRDVVHNQLPAGEAIVRVAHVTYDGERDDEIASNELKVRAAPVFANAIPGLPFGLEGLVGPTADAGTREDRYADLRRDTGSRQRERHAALFLRQRPGHRGRGGHRRNGPGLQRRVARADAALPRGSELRRAGDASLCTARLPPGGIGDTRASLAPVADALREELDRLFIKLRLPSYVIAPRDVETPSLRATIEHLLHDAAAAHGAPADPPGAAIVMRGSYDPATLHELGERLRSAELATALPWAALARLLPDSTPQAQHYRGLLVNRLDALCDADSPDFIEALQHRADSALDGALDVFSTSLRAAVP